MSRFINLVRQVWVASNLLCLFSLSERASTDPHTYFANFSLEAGHIGPGSGAHPSSTSLKRGNSSFLQTGAVILPGLTPRWHEYWDLGKKAVGLCWLRSFLNIANYRQQAAATFADWETYLPAAQSLFDQVKRFADNYVDPDGEGQSVWENAKVEKQPPAGSPPGTKSTWKDETPRWDYARQAFHANRLVNLLGIAKELISKHGLVPVEYIEEWIRTYGPLFVGAYYTFPLDGYDEDEQSPRASEMPKGGVDIGFEFFIRVLGRDHSWDGGCHALVIVGVLHEEHLLLVMEPKRHNQIYAFNPDNLFNEGMLSALFGTTLYGTAAVNGFGFTPLPAATE